MSQEGFLFLFIDLTVSTENLIYYQAKGKEKICSNKQATHPSHRGGNSLLLMRTHNKSGSEITFLTYIYLHVQCMAFMILYFIEFMIVYFYV